MEADFSGWVTKHNVKCTDGRTIMPGAFAHQNGMQVPLVWQHGHKDPENVLGHVLLEDRPEGVYGYAFFNGTDKAKHSATAVDHKDVNQLSIWANQLMERAGRVLHGAIREVSLVLAGANPGAVIENVTIRHADDSTDVLEDEAIIYTGLAIENVNIKHADGATDTNTDDSSDETVMDIVHTMTDKQRNVTYYLVQQALESGAGNDDNADGSAQHGNADDNNDEDKDGKNMSRNVFEDQGENKTDAHVLSHDDMKAIVADAAKRGSLKEAVEAYAEEHLEHGINDIELLFPEARALTTSPEFFKRRTEWVNTVIGGASKSPFSRIKTWVADLTFEAARAKGYIKGTLKKEEFFGVSRRITTPSTVYKKQKLDRDDILDITDFDVVTWMKGEMRLMLEEEIARAVLIGDGRDVADEDKISETNIRPIATDDEFYTVRVNVNLDDASSSYTELIDALILARQHLRGTGLPTMFTTETHLARMLLLKDTLGRRLYDTIAQLETVLRVDKIVTVEVLEDVEFVDLVAVLVNMSDYTIGADKGGQVSMFDDFDIDYNQYKYLTETRISGALTRPRCAMAVWKTGASVSIIAPTVPTFVKSTGVVTIPTQTGVVYKNDDTNATLSAGPQSALAEGATLNVRAEPASSSYAFATSEDDTWSFTRPNIP